MPSNIQPDPLSWRPTMAVVTACGRTWDSSFTDESSVDFEAGYSFARFRVTFSYDVDGKIYYGKYKSGSPVDIGHSFEILYDPNDPASNTGSDVTSKLGTVVGVILFIGLLWILRRYFPE
jgi:hypothetical protein